MARIHNREGARTVARSVADPAPGLRTIARAFELDFVPITEVRCDLVIPADLVEHPTVQIIPDMMQTRDLRDEIGLVPGYGPSRTGKTIAVLCPAPSAPALRPIKYRESDVFMRKSPESEPCLP